MTRVADVSFGRSKLMTGDTPSTSMPRAAMWVAMGSDAAPRARFRRLHRSSHDSSLEGDGFEPSVPRQFFFAAASIPAQFTFRNISRLARDRDRQFESISLQR
jgi:hypothetical protein